MQNLYTENDLKQRLNSHGLGHWYDPLTTLIGRYDGEFFNWIEEDDDAPFNQVSSFIFGLPQKEISDEGFAKLFISLPFLTWRVKNPATDERWNPLKSSLSQWMNFQEYPVAWQWETTYPPEDEILEWLLLQSKTSLENFGKQ